MLRSDEITKKYAVDVLSKFNRKDILKGNSYRIYYITYHIIIYSFRETVKWLLDFNFHKQVKLYEHHILRNVDNAY